MQKETFYAAKTRLLTEFAALGYKTKPSLKVPQVVIDSEKTLFFKPQAIYQNELSMWLDIRGMKAEYILSRMWDRNNCRVADL